MNKGFKAIILFGVIVSMVLMSGCRDQQQTDDKSGKVVTVKRSTPVIPLYYRGVVAPINTYSVVSPFDGRVVALHFHYGETVNEGESVVTISSTQLAEDFQSAVTDYLSKKSTYYNSKEDFAGVEMLYKAGVTSKSDYLSSQSSYQNDVLSYLQSKYQLEKLLHKINIDPEEIEKLSLADKDKLVPLLTKSFNSIPIISPHNGVALFPIAGASDSDDDSASSELHIGSKLNEGELMLSVGDLSGLSVNVMAAEDNINRLHVGMPVTVTSDAFTGTVLDGVISGVSSQADPDTGGGNSLSQFPIAVTVPKVDAAAMKRIKVGMTCKVTINIEGKSALMVPVGAVTIGDNESTVQIVSGNGATKTVKVSTGLTTPTEIVILSGLKEGDKVLVDD